MEGERKPEEEQTVCGQWENASSLCLQAILIRYNNNNKNNDNRNNNITKT